MAGTASLRKIFLTAILALVCGVSCADVLVINPSSKSSPAAVFSIALKNAIPGASFYQATSCADAKRMYGKTPDAIMVYNSSVDFSNRRLGIDCSLPREAKVLMLSRQYMKVCTAADSSSDFTRGRILLGMASMYSTKAHEEDFNRNGFDIRLIPYAGSKDILAAILSKDVQFGFLGGAMSRADGLTCPYSTNPAAGNFIGKFMKLKVPAFRINLVAYSKRDIPELQMLRDDKEFAAYIAQSEFELEWSPSPRSVDGVFEFVDALYAAYR